MTTLEISLSFLAWLVPTVIVFAVAHRYRTERSSFYAGMAFLILTIAGILVVQSVFSTQLSCQQTHCIPAKVMVDTFMQFVLITWGALAGSLLVKVIENKA